MQWIKVVLLLMRPTTLLDNIFLFPPHLVEYDVEPPCFNLAPLGFYNDFYWSHYIIVELMVSIYSSSYPCSN
jgi:hypothetical protein